MRIYNIHDAKTNLSRLITSASTSSRRTVVARFRPCVFFQYA
jgi:hypothetical protein